MVLSQFGHLFAPKPEAAVAEMLRVLKPGGTIAFSTWPPELVLGRLLALGARYIPPLPQGVPPPALWGDPNVVRERLGAARLAVFRREFEAIVADYFEDNAVRHDYLLTRATKI